MGAAELISCPHFVPRTAYHGSDSSSFVRRRRSSSVLDKPCTGPNTGENGLKPGEQPMKCSGTTHSSLLHDARQNRRRWKQHSTVLHHPLKWSRQQGARWSAKYGEEKWQQGCATKVCRTRVVVREYHAASTRRIPPKAN